MRRTRTIIAALLAGVLLTLNACAVPAPATPPTTPTAPTTPATPPTTPTAPTTPATPPTTPAVPKTPAPPTTVQGTNEAWVSIPSREFRPSILTVPVGTRVNWISTDGEPNTIMHTVTSTTGLFSGIVTHGGGTFSYTFTQRGTFNYYCNEHPEMVGKVIVE